MSFFVNVLALAAPIFTLQVYDRVVTYGGISTLYGLVIGMFLVLVFDYVLRQARSRIMQTVALRVDVVVGQRLFDKFTGLPMQLLESKPANHWQSLFRDVDTVRNTLSGASAILLCDLPFVVMFLALIWIVAAPIAWILMIILPLFIFVAWRSAAVMSDANQAERDSTQTRDGMIAEMIAGRTTIKALALEGAMRPIWEEKHADNIENSAHRGARTDAYSNLGQTITMLTTVCMTAVGAIAIVNQELTMGALIATNMLSGRLLGPLNQLVGQWRTFTSFHQSVDRLGEIFETEGDREESEVTLTKPEGEITCENVTFSYNQEGAPTLDAVSVTLHQGGIHALVGRNGSGKTTLLKVIQGLYLPSSGRVLIDGADISQFTRRELATWMGYVPQECLLFQGSVRDNIAHRYPHATDEEIISAAQASGVHQFIIDMPDGYSTDIGEAGRRLSGGQRQRIAIARALVGDPPVLLLDEPSSSLDRQAEQELRNTLVEVAKLRTVIIVTHSPILLGSCDDLIALDKGKIALAGPAKEILPRLFGGQGKMPAGLPQPDVATAALPGAKPEAPKLPGSKSDAPKLPGTQSAPPTPSASGTKGPVLPPSLRPKANGEKPNLPPLPAGAPVAPQRVPLPDQSSGASGASGVAIPGMPIASNDSQSPADQAPGALQTSARGTFKGKQAAPAKEASPLFRLSDEAEKDDPYADAIRLASGPERK